jgi:hypothetical protein
VSSKHHAPPQPKASAAARPASHEPKSKQPFRTCADQSSTLPLDLEDIPTEPELPKERWDAFAYLVHLRIAGYSVASVLERARMLSEFLNVPKYFCKKLTVSAASSRRRQFASRQLAGEVMEIAERHVNADASDLGRRKRKTLGLLARGKHGKACKALMQKETTPLSFAEGRAALELLHPHEPPADLVLRTAGPSFQRLDPDDLVKAIRKC